MRTRQEIEDYQTENLVMNSSDYLEIELLLDIRELLIKQNKNKGIK